MSLYLGNTIIAGNKSLTDSAYTTNRILEIPQDIKLELNNGILTLKAGSKLYRPNGFEADGTTPKFDVVAIENDLTATLAFNGAVVCYLTNTSTTPIISVASLSSETGSGTGTGNGLYYSTDNNRMYVNGSDASTCFPFAIATSSGTQFTSIDQIFNGFGYIGSTVFVLPGVKVQIPNGRNEDGTYRIIPYTTQNVITKEVTGTGVKDILIYPTAIFKLNQVSGGVYLAEDGYNHSITTTTIQYGIAVARALITTVGKIDSFDLRNVDSVANSNASNFSQAGKSYLSGLGMPSNRYIDLTVGVSGSTYTAPANGWFSWYCNQNNNGYVFVQTSASLLPNRVPNSSHDMAGFIPVKQGNIVYVEYANLAFNRLRFIYSEGAN